jgi:hypothetical protein
MFEQGGDQRDQWRSDQAKAIASKMDGIVAAESRLPKPQKFA